MALTAHLGSDVANDDAGQRGVVFEAAELDDEGVWSIVLAVDKQAGHEHAVVGRLAETAGPPLGRGDGGAVCHQNQKLWLHRLGIPVEDKLLCALVVRGRGLEAAEEGAVAELCLCVRAEDLERGCLGEPLADLVLVHLALQRRDKHGVVQVDAGGRGDGVAHGLELVRLVDAPVQRRVHQLEAQPHAQLDQLGTRAEVLVVLGELGLPLDVVHHLLAPGNGGLGAVDDVGQVVCLERGLGDDGRVSGPVRWQKKR